VADRAEALSLIEMRASIRATLARIAAWTAGAVAALALAALLFAWSGLYSVAASRGHWPIVSWFLTFAMQNSVEAHAPEMPVPPLADAGLVQLGAAHYYGGCAPCHGAPGDPGSPVVERMLPPPPSLASAAQDWTQNELFWIVWHGIKYTGMPAWPAQNRWDEVWPVVAFLQKLPQMTAEEYRALAVGGSSPREPGARTLALAGAPEISIAACARCHGAAGERPRSDLVPTLNGQRFEYLRTALVNYATAVRPSGIMQPISAELSTEEIDKLAAYYAGLSASKPAPQEAANPDLTALGGTLAAAGDRSRGVPACHACHAPGKADYYPRLAGQNESYIRGQLELWRRGGRIGHEAARIMATVAKRLTEEQVAAVAAYFAHLEPQPEPAALASEQDGTSPGPPGAN
jgi:cytochrome c553